jgi:hypothetical protein
MLGATTTLGTDVGTPDTAFVSIADRQAGPLTRVIRTVDANLSPASFDPPQ